MQKVSVEVNDLIGSGVQPKLARDVFIMTVSACNSDCLQKKKLSLSLAMVPEDEIRKHNSHYRGKDDVTDVLSFPEYEGIGEICNCDSEEIFLGEIVMCTEYIKESAKANGVEYDYELPYILSHGILHLLGFLHGDEMFSIQDKIAIKLRK